jgi:acetyl-CoA synthetase
MDTTALDSILEEQESVAPSEEFVKNAVVPDPAALRAEAKADPEAFWAKQAGQLDWYKPWDTVLDWKPPHANWFVGGQCNIVANAIDRHLNTERRDKVALMWEGENGDLQTYTYAELNAEVSRLANGLRSLGVTKGDRITLYMPVCPQLAMAMLATVKIGAIHTVVFGGFSATALKDRIQDSDTKVVITADGGYQRGKVVPLQATVEEAVADCPSVEHTIVYSRIGDGKLNDDKQVWWHDLVENQSTECETQVMESNDHLYILYTSGTTGKPKGIVHRHGGYMVGTAMTAKWVFDLKDDDIYWCTADMGWVTGHSYVVYGPLINGATVFLAEGSPDFPDIGRWWRMIEQYGITICYTAPTAIRMFMGKGEEWPNKYDLSSLRVLGTVGEPINPEAWRWYDQVIGKGRCPIVDTWWQTETGMIMICTLPAEPQKPGSAGLPLPGVFADVVDPDGNSVEEPGKGGFLAVRQPWPAMLGTIYGDDDRYRTQYWEEIQGDIYAAGDASVRDEDGYIRVLGRMDDVLNVAGHRLGTMEIESALVAHDAVAEAAVIGIPHEIKGQVPKAFVILQKGFNASDELQKELVEHVGIEIGKIARPSGIDFVPALPKTRSGKIMRRLLKAQEAGETGGDTSTLDPSSFVDKK